MTEATPGRGQNGKFTRTVETAEKDAKAALLRSRGLSFSEIAAQLDFADSSGAHRAYRRALAAVPVEAVGELRALETQKLDAMERTAWAALMRTYHLAQHGKIVIDPDGNPVEDVGPKLAAIDRLLKIAERRARLLGLDAPTRIEARNVSQLDAEIEDLLARVAGRPEIEPGDVVGESPDEA